jgi:UDP-N-acetylglucosamine acyltransferase
MPAPDIHSTALVDRRATLADGVRIGAFTVVGPEVTLEAGVELGHHVILEGRVAVGAGARIGHGVVLGAVPQDLKFKEGTPVGVTVGAATVIREYVTVSRATKPDTSTVIGSGCLLMTGCHVAHDSRLGDGVIVINSAGITGHCIVGDRATIGGFVGLVPFTRVGTHAYVGGYSKCVADIPPYVLADGNPATARAINVVGLRRAGMDAAERRLLQDAFRILYRSGLSPRRAAERIRDTLPPAPSITELLGFIAGSRRGICGSGEAAGTEGTQEPAPVAGEGER